MRLDQNRCQGISVVSARRVLIADVDIRNAPPAAGIDLEPDDRNPPNEDVTIRGGYFAGNEQDILMVWGNRNVTIDGPTLRSKNGVVVRDGSRGVRIVGTDIYALGTAGGTAAIQLDAVDPSTIDGIEISGNTLRGGAVVLDVPHERTRGVRVLDNRIHRDCPSQTSYRLRARGAQWSGNRVRE